MTVKKQQEPRLSICSPSRANPFPYLSVNGLGERRLLPA